MKIVSTAALGVVLALGVAAAPAAAKDKAPKAAAGVKYTPAFQGPASDAQKALVAGDMATAQAKYTEAKAAAQTDDDRYALAQIGIGIGQKTNNDAIVSESIDMALASNKAAPDQAARMYLFQAEHARQARDWPKAEAAIQGAMRSGSTEENLVPLLVEVQAQSGRKLVALQTLNDAIAKRTAAGQTTPNDWYGRGINLGYAGGKPSADQGQINVLTTKLTLAWLTAYPTKSNWRDALIIYRDQYHIDAEQELDMMRLQRTAGALKGERDYTDYVIAAYSKYPNEAKSVIDEGVSAGMINLATNKNAGEINGIVKGKVASDKASLASSEKAAQGAATGRIALATADGYASYGDYAKAVPLYRLALTKGGVDAGTVNTRLGAALAKSGQKDAARQAFAAVTGPRQGLASFWTIYLDHPPTA